MNELVAILGGSWRQIFLYPGGLTLLVLAGASYPLWRHSHGRRWQAIFQPRSLLLVVTTWLCCASTPWPRTYWAYPIDIVTAFVLLEGPHWVSLRTQLAVPEPQRRSRAMEELVALLRVYPLVALAVAMLAQASASLLVVEIQRSTGYLRSAGLVLWALCVPVILGLGPWRQGNSFDLGTAMRRVSHAALLAMMVLPGGEGLSYAAAAVAMGACLGSLILVDYLWRGPAQRWERLQPGIAIAGLTLLLWAAYGDVIARLR